MNSSNTNTLYIDFEAFQHGNGSYELKELCIFQGPYSYMYFIFRPNTDWLLDYDDEARRTFAHLSRRLHRLHWEEGHARYCNSCVFHHITHRFTNWHNAVFIVLDRASGPKITFLRQEFPQLNIVHAYNLTFNTLPDSEGMTCPYRNHGKHCAFIKCCQLHKHFNS